MINHPISTNAKLDKQFSNKVRIAGLDILKTFAIIFVIGGHYFLNTNFNDTPFDNPIMFVLGLFQSLTIIGVPLFLMITGYLNLSKTTPSKKYFKGISRVLIAYLAFSAITILFRKYHLGHEKSIFQWSQDILSFNAIKYAWYIEMWIGLFLLTPFLNKLWTAIDNKREHLILILILFGCTSLPDFTNRYGFNLLPDYWIEATYPLLCFFLGAYMRTYQPKIKSKYLIFAITGLCLINPVLSMILAPGQPMLHLQGSPRGLVAIPLTICFFLLFYKIDIKNGVIKAIVTKVSLLSLNMYLVAYLFDQWFYPYWKNLLGESQLDLGPFYFLIILSLVIGTFLTSWVYEILSDILKYIFNKNKRTSVISEINPI